MASVKDSNLREILAKEILTYDPPQFKPADLSDNYAKLNQLMKVNRQLSLNFGLFDPFPMYVDNCTMYNFHDSMDTLKF